MCKGEGIRFCADLDEKMLREIGAKLGIHDLVENLTLEDGIHISLQTPGEYRQSQIEGTMWGEGVSRKVAENIVDGVAMTDEEYDRLNDE